MGKAKREAKHPIHLKMSDKTQPSSSIARSSDRPSITTRVIVKLLVFSALLFAAPLLTYFYSIDTIFSGNTTYAAGAAALVANLVVIGYILAAMIEDMSPDKDKEKKKD
ncbi:hypothetical protein DM01DRAFT_1047387 [Hesseltinella vesiculosa]|uniref:Uncharacterized protein n=1 Tax=Hesseltinella vesiculosa TaxID=101127 RepID=A0A1X2GH25_9FUNG|nr:hypothetical protein DM01DRAFT_1047387 [Hesseltinella vesiculosa]